MPTRNPETEFRHAIARGSEPQCVGYEDIFILYERSSAPTRAEAKEMCSGCPLLELCDEMATKWKPVWGVWGGKIYGIKSPKNY